jgi:hypothetical protein
MSILKCRVGVEWIDTFINPCKNMFGLPDLSYCDEQTDGFFNDMGNAGHIQVFRWIQQDSWETDFRDPSFGNGGDSVNWTDNVNFFFFASHGGNSNNIFSIFFSNQHNLCNSSSNTWRLGSHMLKWIVFATCDVILNTTPAHVGAVWGPPCQGLHLILAFVGTCSDDQWTDSLGSDFANDINGNSSIGGAWLDDAYSFWKNDESVVIACGNTVENAIIRRDSETLDWLFNDVDVTAALAWKWKDSL